MINIASVIKDNKTKCICAGAAIAVAVLLASLVSCSSASMADDIGASDAIGATLDEMVEAADGIELGDAEGESAEFDGSITSEGQSTCHAQESSEAGSAPSQGQTSVPAAQSAPAPSGQSGGERPTPSAPQKKWVEDTEQVWIEDRAAWSEQVPIYGSKEVSICNVCGADVTGNAASHGKAHMLAGEGSGHHSEVRQVVTGYNTVSHAAEGHWETRITGGHWE